LTSELPKKPESFCFPLLPVQICPHLDPKIAVFGIANLAYAAEINFTTCDLCLRNPNTIALHSRAMRSSPSGGHNMALRS
jgi:hypothetical protein